METIKRQFLIVDKLRLAKLLAFSSWHNRNSVLFLFKVFNNRVDIYINSIEKIGINPLLASRVAELSDAHDSKS